MVNFHTGVLHFTALMEVSKQLLALDLHLYYNNVRKHISRISY